MTSRALRRFRLVAVSAWLGCAAIVSENVARAEEPKAADKFLHTWGSEPDPAPVSPPPSATASEAKRGEDERTAPGVATSSADGAPSEDSGPRPVSTRGLKYVIERVEVRGNRSTLPRVILRFLKFSPGDTLDVDDPELSRVRFRLLSTGFFRDVQIALRRGKARGTVTLLVTVEERNTIVVNDVWLGLSADAEPNGSAKPLTAFGGIDLAETNLAGTGVTLGGAVAVAERQLALRTRFSDPDFLRSGWTVEGQLLYNNAKDFFGQRDALVDDPSSLSLKDYAVVAYERAGGLVGVGHALGAPNTQLYFDYRLESLSATLPRAASHRRGLDVEPLDFYLIRGSSLLSTVRTTFVYDTRDKPALPIRGHHLSLSLEGAVAPFGSDYSYAKVVGRYSVWTPLPWKHVFRFDVFGGSAFGDAPLFERFYVGDFSDFLPDRVLDLAVDRRAPPNFFGTTIAEVRYGTYAARMLAEYRIPIYRGVRAIRGVDLFASAGFYALANAREFSDAPRGYSGFRRIPLDATFNVGFRVDSEFGALNIGTSTLIGLVPVRGGAQ
ncbi:MAG: BamA/TamA family outer membrane protein [Polyangiaceae bacterium]